MDTLQVDVNDLVAQRTETGWQGMPDDAKIGHLHLKTADLEQARHYYIDRFGSRTYFRLPTSAIYVYQMRTHHHIAANVWQ